MLVFCIDIDETLCHGSQDDYPHSVPDLQAITSVNRLYDAGNYIKIFTGRNDKLKELTEKQLLHWGIKYNELIMNKPYADVFIDDKAINVHDWLESTRLKKGISRVERDWGVEVWLVNCDEYCGKLLYLPKGACAEYHYHEKKKETFYGLQGQVDLNIDGNHFILDQFSKPITIEPKAKHSFRGITNAIFLEVSTHHDENDVVFLSEAKPGEEIWKSL